jgi:GNAT superfamily N-acetyltransferase
MEEEHLEELVKIDEITFKRFKPRSIANLNALRLSDPNGCFIVTDEQNIVGYNYSKKIGCEGYIGPLGIIPDYQNKGLGKALIQKSIQYLRKECKVIGLEVLPENGNIIGLYQKRGFIPGFPSYLFNFPNIIRIETNNMKDITVKDAEEIDSFECKSLVNKIETWTKDSLKGVNFTKDLTNTLELNGDVLFAFNGGNPIGFL